MIVTVKAGVSFAVIAPAGFRLLGAIERTARRLQMPLVITCACEAHPPTDPHSHGEAFDVRTHDFDAATKLRLLRALMEDLVDEADPTDGPTTTAGGIATREFFGQVEHPDQPTEHLHVQRRKGTVYA